MKLPNYKSENGINNLTVEPPRAGFTKYAEILNGRLAMLGFVILLSIEVFLRHH